MNRVRALQDCCRSHRSFHDQAFIKIRFSTLCDQYRDRHFSTLKPRTRNNYLGHISVLADHFKDQYADEIRRADIAALVASLKGRSLKTATIRRYLATLSSVLGFAVRSGWIPDNPVVRFDKRLVPEAQARTRFLSHGEYRRLLKCSGSSLRPVLEIAVHTGMRLEEILSLRWTQVDLNRREIELQHTKSKRPRVIPLSDPAVATLVAMHERSSGQYVFTNPATGTRYRSLRSPFRTACRRAGIEDMRFHDLRHTFASWAVQSGVDLYRLSRILGHTTLQMTTRYAHLSTDHLHEAVRSMATSVATASSDYAGHRAGPAAETV